MRYVIFLLLLFLAMTAVAQKETFDLATYTTPRSWTKKPSEQAVQLMKEDAAKGTYCIITLYKAIAAGTDAKKNFDQAWETLVKETITVSAAPEMQPAASEDGWEVQSGYSTFEMDGQKGIVLLVTTSGYNTMVNIVILTNTDAYESTITSFLESISLKKPKGKIQPAIETNDNNANKPMAGNGGFAFHTTNFDDGWNAAIRDSYVEVSKGPIKVFLFYQVAMTSEMRDPVIATKRYFWNTDVKPRYNILTEDERMQELMYTGTDYLEGDATDLQTGANVYVGMLVTKYNGTASNIVVVAPDKNAFLKEFPKPNNLSRMLYYNRFAVGPNDLVGNWSDFSGAYGHYYFTGTGGYAGMSGASLSAEFRILSDGTYTSEHKGATGFIGAQQVFQQKYKGKYKVTNNWNITLTNRFDGKTEEYTCWFEVIKDGRILHFDGNGMTYQLFKEKK